MWVLSTCGEPDEIKNIDTQTGQIAFLFFSFLRMRTRMQMRMRGFGDCSYLRHTHA